MCLRRRAENDGSFHYAMSRVLMLGNFVGFPVIGIYTRDIFNIKFKWKSISAIYSVYLLIMSTFFLVCYFIWLIKSSNEFTVQTFVTFSIRLRNVFCLVLFQRLAQNWNHFIMRWTNVERYLPMFNSQHERNFIRRRITLLQIAVISISLSK